MKEKYEVPAANDIDKLRETKESLLGLVPGGSLVNQLVDTFFSSPLEKRRDSWMTEIANGLMEAESEISGLRQQLAGNDVFLDILYSATAAAMKTSCEAKRQYLRNFVINSAVEPDFDESYRKSLLSKLDRIEHAHVTILMEVEESRGTYWGMEGSKTAKGRCFESDLRSIGIDVSGPDVGSDGVGQVGRDLLALILAVPNECPSPESG